MKSVLYPVKVQQSVDKSIDKKSIFVNRTIHDEMITPEEYEKRVKQPDIVEIEDDNMRLPIPVVVTIIVLSSLVCIFIVCEAIFGL